MNKIECINTKTIYGAITLKDKTRPEQNNMALHKCIDPDQVMINRKELEKEIQHPLSQWVLPWQKHTANIQRVTSSDKGKGAFEKETSIMDVDALYTTEKGILIGVFTADCQGILIVDETTPLVCVIHSGWKGTALEITKKTLQRLNEEHLIHPETTHAYFSPSLLQESLEVGMEVVDLIKQMSFDTSPYIEYRNDKGYIDNQGLNIKMCQDAGIMHIHPTKLDTKKELDLCFSYRNDKQTGEHFTFGYIKMDDRSS